MSAIPLERIVDYPESDGRPMAETEVHGEVMMDLLRAFRRRYADVPDVYVWGNMLLYYVKGDPRACVAPDLFLVKGVDKRQRRTYKLWEEGRAPSLVIEVTSKSTKSEDVQLKKGVYQRLGVAEYFLFDPLGEYLRPRLQEYRLSGGRYEPMSPTADGTLTSREADLLLTPEGARLRLRDAATGERLLWSEELDEALRTAEEQAEREAQAREAAEERVRLLEAELARLRGSAKP
jgi:Uma2 family endonuclease